MAYQYAVGNDTGIGFITHEDKEQCPITGYPGNVWLTDDSEAASVWIARNALATVSRIAAQALIEAACAGKQNPDGTPVVAPVLP